MMRNTNEIIAEMLHDLETTPCNCKVCNHPTKFYCGEDCKCCRITKQCPCQQTKVTGGTST